MAKRYGIPREPETREWGYLDDAKEVQTAIFHPRQDVGFEEIIEFSQLRATGQETARQDASDMAKALSEIAKAQATKVTEDDGTERDKFPDEEQIDDDEAKVRFEKVIEEFREREYTRLKSQVELALYMVDEHDHEMLRPRLLKGHPVDLRGLIEDLHRDVILKAAKQVEAVMGADPTSAGSQPT